LRSTNPAQASSKTAPRQPQGSVPRASGSLLASLGVLLSVLGSLGLSCDCLGDAKTAQSRPKAGVPPKSLKSSPLLHGSSIFVPSWGSLGLFWGSLGLSWRSSAFQGSPERPKASQGVSERPRASQGVPERSRESQNVPGRPRASQDLPGPPETSQGVPGRSGARVGHGAQCADAPVWEWCTNWRRSGSNKKKQEKQKIVVRRKVARRSILGPSWDQDPENYEGFTFLIVFILRPQSHLAPS